MRTSTFITLLLLTLSASGARAAVELDTERAAIERLRPVLMTGLVFKTVTVL